MPVDITLPRLTLGWVNDNEKRKLETAREALCVLAEANKPLTRKEIFSSPRTGQHLQEAWEFRFLNFLANHGILAVQGERNPLYSLQKDLPKESEAGQTLTLLLSSREVLKTLVLTGKNPLEPPPFPENENHLEVAENSTETVIKPQEDSAPGIDQKLDLIAEHLVAVMQCLVYLRQAKETQDQKIDSILNSINMILKNAKPSSEPDPEPSPLIQALINGLQGKAEIPASELQAITGSKDRKGIAKAMLDLGYVPKQKSGKKYGKKGSVYVYFLGESE